MTSFADILFTPGVVAAQRALGSHGAFDRRYAAKRDEPLGAAEQDFLASRSTLYIASVNSDGWPYLQHRGGPAGFIKVLDPFTIGFADYRGNRQVITRGNLATDDRVSLFAMDYARKARLKLLGHARMADAADDPALAEALATEGQGQIERTVTIRIAAWDWNCPQFITPRFDAAEIAALVGPEITRLETRITELEAENAALKPQTRTPT